MFTPVSMRSANTYRSVGLETSVLAANPHQLVALLFDGLLQSLTTAKGAILSGDISAKERSIRHAVRILEEGLKAELDLHKGGELANNLRRLYDYSISKTSEANWRNDAAPLDEVMDLLKPLADGWKQIGDLPVVQSYRSRGEPK